MSFEKLEDRGIKTDSRFLRWLDNYWYHYKWRTIVIAFFLIVFLICTVQMCSREEADITVMYAGSYQMTGEETANLSRILSDKLPCDYDKNGEKSVEIVSYHIYSEEQIKQIESQTDSEGVVGSVNRNLNSTNYQNYLTYIQTGDVAICLVDPWLYESLLDADRLMKLSEALPSSSEVDRDAYGIRLGDTALYEQYGSVRVLPADTVLVFLRAPVAGKMSKEKYYAREKEMLTELIPLGKVKDAQGNDE